MIKHFSIFLLILLLIGCASPQAVDLPEPTPTVTAAANVLPPTPAMTVTATPPQPTATSLMSTAGEAQAVLIEFFELLNAGNYAEAEALYGGSYEDLQANNPALDPSDHAQLLANACEINGHQCLLVRSSTFKGLRGDTYIFQVEFSNPDGSPFVQGPCCGADETQMPPISQFEYEVDRVAGARFVVLDLPPYVP